MAVVEGERIAFVLAGGGARGAYEAGALSVLGPELERLGHRPSMFLGTSVGALNATYLAANRHRSAEEVASGLIENWRAIAQGGGVVGPLFRQLPVAMVRYTGQVLSVPGFRLPSLLQPQQLHHTVEHWIDLADLHHNVASGAVDVLAVVATAVRSGRTVVFVEGAHSRARHRSHIIDYVPTEIEKVHLRASEAIPVLFPPVYVDTPPEARGWYLDGGTRLNTPIKPALDLGAERVVVIGTDTVGVSSHEPGRHEGDTPDVTDGALHLLAGALVDPLAEDIVMLGNVNLFFSGGEIASPTTRYRHARGKPPYRRVPYVFVAPEQQGQIGALALEIFRARSRGLNSLRTPTVRLLGQLLGGDSPTRGELLSYLLFDREFLEELIELGQRDARRRLQSDDPWQIGPPASLTNGAPDARATGPGDTPGHDDSRQEASGT